MRLSLLIILSTILFSCSTSKKSLNTAINEKGNLVGIADKTSFQQTPFNDWFAPNYKDYQLDLQITNQIKPLLKGVKIKAVMGTWCGDSRREIPHFYKLLDAVDFNYKNLQMITVDRSKKSTNNEQEGLDIIRVPTFIFYKNGKEINRFVEYPVETLEKDFLKILQEVGYKHAYK
ncbi:MAG TPA: thioredoxin [Lutibacter sp.]|nr:thioredoxin [Lutibacter sp.]